MPYLLDVQADVLSLLGSRVVVPLAPERSIPGVPSLLQPTLEVEGQKMMMLTPLLAAISKASLGERVGSVVADGPVILRALDFLLTGS